MSIQNQKITDSAVAANGVQSQPDKLTGTAAQNKKVFDNLVTAVVKARFNALIDELTGTGAAGQLGIKTIPGYSAATVQAMLEQIVTAMQDITQGAVADKSITLAKLAEEVTATAIGGAAASHNHGAGNITSGTLAAERIPVLDSTKLGAGSVGTSQLASAAVTTQKIKDAAITAEKIAALAVLATHIAAGAVTTPKIASKAVTGEKIADGAVGTAQLGSKVVTGEKIADGAVGTSNLGSKVVTTDKIANGAITNALIAAGGIERGSLAASALGNASGDLSATPFAAENNGRLLIFASDSDVSYTLTQALWSSLNAGFSVTILKANSATSGTLTINWESMAGVYDFTQGTVKYNNTGSVKLVRRGDMVTFEKWGSTTRLLISGNFNTPNFYKGTSATPPSTLQPGDIYLQYQ